MVRVAILIFLGIFVLLAAAASLPQLRLARAAAASLLIASSLLPESLAAHLAQAAPTAYPSPACTPNTATTIALPASKPTGGLRSKLNADWKPVRIGAGGWVTGIDIASDGTMVVRTDTYGAYLWNGSSWQQLVTAASMPTVEGQSAGVYEIRIAPSNTSIFYLQNAEGIWRSDNRGARWVKTSFNQAVNANDGRRMDGQKLAIDPHNPAIVYAGTQKFGLWRTQDGGRSWQVVSDVPQGTGLGDASMTGIVISGNRIVVGTGGAGVYESRDAGRSWKSIGGPAAINHSALTADGALLASANDTGALWRFNDGQWTQVIDGGVQAIAVDPRDPNHVVVTRESGNLRESHDQGRTWGGWNWANQQESDQDIPWLAKSGVYMSAGGLAFDPKQPGKLWQSAGVGVWETNVPAKFAWNQPIVWHSKSRGIEQLVANTVLAPPGGDPVFASWDRAFFKKRNLDQFSDCYGGGDFSMGWSLDYASSDPRVLVGISNWWGKEESGISRDGGRSWQRFGSYPRWPKDTIGGAIAASTPRNFVWVPAGKKAPVYTSDGGQTWQEVSIPKVAEWPNLHFAYYLNRKIVAADRVLPNTFYLVDTETGTYRSADGGRGWERVNSKPPQEWSVWNSRLEAMPGRAGVLYFTSGPQGTDSSKAPGALPLVRSDDGGRSWKDVPGIRATTFGFGAPVVANGPATIYVVGFYKDVFGIWGSPDEGRTWVSLARRPLGSLDAIKTVSGDMARPGRVYVGFGGSGYAYLDQ